MVIQKSIAFTYPGVPGKRVVRFGNRGTTVSLSLLSIFVPVRLGLAARDAMGPVSYYRTTIICFAFLELSTSLIVNDMKNVNFFASESSQQCKTYDVTPLEESECAINGKINEYMSLNSPYCNLQLQSTYQEYSARFDRISLGNDDARILDRADFRITKTSDFLRQLRGSTCPHAPRLIEAIRQELLFTAFRQLDVGRFSSHWQTIQEHGSIVVQKGNKVFMCGPLAFSDNVLHITTSYMKIEQDTLVEVPGFIDAQYMSRTSTWVDTESRENLRLSDDNSGDDKSTITLDQIINSHDLQAVRVRQEDGKAIPGVYACCFAKSRIGLKTLQSVQIYTACMSLLLSCLPSYQDL